MSKVWRAGGRKGPAKKPTGQQVQVSIDGYAHDGQGVGRYQGKPIFIADALQGETVTAKVEQQTSKRTTAQLIEVVEASADRREAACEYFGHCGGCVWQHLSYEAQAQAKRDRFLHLIGKLDAQPIEDEMFLTDEYAYRRRARFAVAWQDGKAIVGYRARKAKRIVGVDHCLVLSPQLDQVLGQISNWLSPLKGGVSEVLVTELDRVHVALGVGSELTPENRALLAASAQDNGWVYSNFEDQVDSASLTPYDFVQANQAANVAMQHTLKQWLGVVDGKAIVDLFSGLGNFSNYLADLGATVTGIEIDKGMVARANKQAHPGANFKKGNLFEGTLPRSMFAADILVLDPPRAGAHHIAQQIVEQADKLATIKTIAYISCDPATQVRDAQLLMQANFRLNRVRVVDMFAQTPHIETMMLFTKES